MSDGFYTKLGTLLDGSPLSVLERADLRLRVLTDHFCTRSNHEGADLERIDGSLRRACDHASGHALARAAHRLATHPQATTALLSKLVACGGEAACVALRHGPIADREALARLAERGDAASAEAIATRGDLSRDLVTILFRRPERDVLIALARNASCHLDRQTAAWLVSRARHDHDLARALLSRGPLACDLTPLFLAADTRQRATMIADARRRNLGAMPEYRRETPASVADVLMQVASRSDRAGLADALARHLGLPRAEAVRLVDDKGGEALALALNGLGISILQATEILCRSTGLSRDDGRLVALLQLATDLARQTARDVLAAVTGLPISTSGDSRPSRGRLGLPEDRARDPQKSMPAPRTPVASSTRSR